MVPNGWSLKLISDTAKVITGNTPSTKDSSYYNGDIPFVSPADLGANKLISSANKTLTKKGFEKSRAVRKGSTLFTCIGSTIGKLGQANCELATNQQINAVIPYSSFDDDFIYYQLEMRAKFISKLASTQAVPIINKTTFESQYLLVPDSLPEQRKIAQILSTWDRGIATTEKLIDASKQQKKALMQQLLTGKKRLVDPETGKAFEGEWEHGFLGDLCTFKGGSAFKEVYQGQLSGDYPFIKVSDMNLPQNGKFILQANNWITDEVAKTIKAKAFNAGSVVFAKVGAALLLNRRRILVQPTIVDNNMMAATPKNICSTEFLYQLMLMIDFAKFVQDGAVPSINQSDLSRFKISYPHIEEQQKIASVLTAADNEVELLEAKLAHLKQEKNALMQQLLTGKRRVKVAETEAA